MFKSLLFSLIFVVYIKAQQVKKLILISFHFYSICHLNSLLQTFSYFVTIRIGYKRFLTFFIRSASLTEILETNKPALFTTPLTVEKLIFTLLSALLKAQNQGFLVSGISVVSNLLSTQLLRHRSLQHLRQQQQQQQQFVHHSGFKQVTFIFGYLLI